MKRAISLLFPLLLFVVLGAVLTNTMAQQQEASFVRGQKLSHMLSICLDKNVAVAIMDADAKDGFEAAKEIWDKNDRCATVPVQGPTVGKVVKTSRVTRDGKQVTVRVVEIVNGGEVIGYFFTTATVDERNS